MPDYAQWILRASSFVATLQQRAAGIVRFENAVVQETPAPQLTDEIEYKIRRPLPRPLREFFNVCGGTEIWYTWTPPPNRLRLFDDVFPRERALHGGPSRFCLANWVPRAIDDCRALALAATPAPDGSATRAQWLFTRSLPFTFIRNGDYLAFDLSTPSDDPPILYLSHDSDDSTVIAPGFDAFLVTWERLCYVGPELWLLDPFLRPNEHGGELLDADSDRAARLRKLLSIA